MEDIAAMLTGGLDLNRRDGSDIMPMLIQQALSSLPEPPVSTDAPLRHALAGRPPGDDVDPINSLPVKLLRNIVSRLPAKDAARTTVLSTRWRRVWHSVPLVLVDAHLAPLAVSGIFRLLGRARDPRDYRTPPLNLAAVVSAVLAVHPGPFRCVYLTGSNMDGQNAVTARWFQLLAAKGVRELVFVNRIRNHGDLVVQLPGTLFRCISLTKLYLGFWCFPDTATLPRPAAFPYLREVGLCSLIMKPQDLAFLLERCPVLEKLLMIGCKWPVCIRVQSCSLRCVQVCSSVVKGITVVHASRLERLLLWEAWGDGGPGKMSSTIKIGHAPKLRFLGLLVTAMHQLEIGNTIIKAGTKASPNTIVPSVQVLAIQVRLGTRAEARMLPSFLRCFPNVDTLYIQSENDDFNFWGPVSGGTGKVSLKFWEEAGPIECIQKHIKKLVLREFRGRRSELNFLKFVAERARVLEKMEIVLTPRNSPSDQVGIKLRTFMASAKWSNGCCELTISQSPFPQEGIPWCYGQAFDLSNQDPFDVSKCHEGKCASH